MLILCFASEFQFAHMRFYCTTQCGADQLGSLLLYTGESAGVRVSRRVSVIVACPRRSLATFGWTLCRSSGEACEWRRSCSLTQNPTALVLVSWKRNIGAAPPSPLVTVKDVVITTAPTGRVVQICRCQPAA